MRRAREYDWEYELPNGLPVVVGASITGQDTPWSMSSLDPPEYREVEITIERYWPSGHKIDITDSVERLWPDFLDEMRTKAIEMEDDKLAAEYEDRFDWRDDT